MNTKLLSIALLTSTFGCAGAPWDDSRPTVRDSLLAYVPESEQANIAEARTHLAQLREELAAARNDEAEAERLVDIADRNVDSLESRLGTAREQIDYARAHGTNEDLEHARQQADELASAVRLARTQKRYQEDLEDLGEERVDLLQSRIDLAAAKLELAKARAVRDLDRPAVEDVDVDDHRHAVDDLAQDVETARIDALVARHRVELQQEFVQRNQEGVPDALRLQTVQPIEAIFEAKAYASQPGDGASDPEARSGRTRSDASGNREQRRDSDDAPRDGR